MSKTMLRGEVERLMKGAAELSNRRGFLSKFAKVGFGVFSGLAIGSKSLFAQCGGQGQLYYQEEQVCPSQPTISYCSSSECGGNHCCSDQWEIAACGTLSTMGWGGYCGDGGCSARFAWMYCARNIYDWCTCQYDLNECGC